jgi:hypothetical protein
MSTAYQTALFISKVGASSGHGISRMSTHLHAISGAINTWAQGDTIAVGFVPRGAVVTNVIMKAASQLDSGGAPTLALDLGVVGTPQLFKAAVTTVGRAAGASVDTTNTAAGYLFQNNTGGDLEVLATVHTAAETPVSGTLEFDVEYYVEDTAGSNP